MSIYSDIKKVTQIPYSDENSTFIRQREPNMSKRNRKINKHKPPQNVNLYDQDDDDDDNNDNNQKYNNVSGELYESEIASSIKEANCGINYSNEILEKHWKARQIEASLNSDNFQENNLPVDKTNCNCNNSSVETNNEICMSVIKIDEDKDTEDEENILKKYKLNKNAAIRGLLRNQKISLQDLQIPNDSVGVKHKSDISTQNGNVSSLNDLTEEKYNMELIPYPEDSEVFVQPLQAFGSIDENKYKDIDFSVPHIGKKKTVTSRQFYVRMDDSGFDFVKKDVKRET